MAISTSKKPSRYGRESPINQTPGDYELSPGLAPNMKLKEKHN